MKRVKQNGAFSLVEVLLTIAAVSVLSLGLIPLFTNSLKRAEYSRKKSVAMSIVESRLELLRNSTWEQLAYSNNFIKPTFLETNDAVYRGTVSTNWPKGTNSYKDAVLPIVITVRWGPLNNEERIQVVTLVTPYGITGTPK